MTEQHRTALLTACAYAKTFLTAADLELRGGSPTFREECAYQLAAALRNLNPPAADVPVVDWTKEDADVPVVDWTKEDADVPVVDWTKEDADVPVVDWTKEDAESTKRIFPL